MNASSTEAIKKNDTPVNEAGDGKDRRLLVGYLHKTSNTLCGIKGYASLIADRGSDEGEAGRWARKIIAEVERMEEIFRSVGDLTRGPRHPDVGVDLPGLINDLVRNFSRDRSGMDVRVGSIPEGELRLPLADLVLMISEILNNCAESGAPGQSRVAVEIHGECDREGRVSLLVTDDGVGMEPELVSQLASPFVTTKEGHLGVGLTRVDTLMEMYGLDWSVRSEDGRGTRISLEVAEAF